MVQIDDIVDEIEEDLANPAWTIVLRAVMWTFVALLTLALLATAMLLALDTSPGRAWLAERIEALSPDSGLKIRIGRLDGSLFGNLRLSGLELSDPDGVFLKAPAVTLDWQPQAMLTGRLHIDTLGANDIFLLKVPDLIPDPRKDQPLLPDYDIYVGRFAIGNLRLAKPVLGKPQQIRASGSINITSGRLLGAIEADSVTGGDTLVIRVDSEPDKDKFDIDGRITAPADGVIAGILKFDKPFAARIDGDGTWTKWQGRSVAVLGDDPFFDLAITANAGTFVLQGMAAPALAKGGIIGKLGTPRVDIDIKARFEDRVLATEVSMLSKTADIDGGGQIDLGRGRFRDFKLHFDVLDPSVLIRTMTAANMQMDIVLHGATGQPDFDYVFSADWLAIGTTRLDRIKSSGTSILAGEPVEIPLDATISRITGVGDFVEELATTVRLKGSVNIKGYDLRGTKLDVRSDRVTAKADIYVDLRTGAYDVDAVGDLPAYVIPGFGMVDVKADLNFRPDGRDARKLRLRGRADARMRRLDNSFLLWVFQGLPQATAHIDRGPDGTIHISDALLRAPDTQLKGNGTYALGQKINLTGSGTSQRFGKFAVKLDGLVSRPHAKLNLASYYAGLTLENVRAEFIPTPDAYGFTALADSFVGPVTSNGRIGTAAGATTYDIAALNLMGVTASGRLVPTTSGPLKGVMTVTGGGIGGTVTLSGVGENQRYDADLTARSARLALASPVAIRRGTLKSVIDIEPDGLGISGQFDLEGVRQDRLFLNTARGTLEMTDRSGTAVAIIAGERGVPFTLDMATSFDPDMVFVSSKGTIARRAFRLAEQAHLSKAGDGWQLAPVTLVLPEGSARLSGRFGKTVTLSADLSSAGLDLFDLAIPGIGLTGEASGKVAMTFPPGALPRGTARLRVKNFTRATEAYSQPVDLAIVAALEANKAAIRAAFQTKGKVVGQMQARLTSIPGDIDDPWADRLSAAPLTAEIKWRGPSEMLWPLTGVGSISLRGNVALAVNVSGKLGDPNLNGRVISRQVRMESGLTGTVVDNIKLDGRFTGSRLDLQQFSGTAGKGQISGSGHIDMSLARGFPVSLVANLQSAQILNRDDLNAVATGTLNLRNSPEGGLISGDFSLDRANFMIGRTAQSEAAALKVKEKNTELLRARPVEATPIIWKLDVKARANNQVTVKGMGLDSEWSANLDITGPAREPRLLGTANLIRGEYEFAGRRFTLTRGKLRFTGSYPPDPLIDLVAEARVEGLTATIAIGGTGQKPLVSFSSIPALPQDEVLSRVLFGTSVSNLSAPEALQLAGAIASLQGGNGGLNPIDAVRSAVGIDRLRLQQGSTANGQRTALAAGEYLTDRVYVEVASDAQGYTATQLEVELTRSLSILSQLATLGGTSVNLRWSKDY